MHTEKLKASDFDLNEEKVVAINRTTKVIKGGRRFSFTAIVVVGDDKKNVIGFGVGKGRDVQKAIRKGGEQARKNIVRIPLRNGTIHHPIEGRYGATRVIFRPATPGTGISAGSASRIIAQAAGIKDLLSKKIRRPNNPHNLVKATLDALLNQQTPYMVAKKRGITVQQVFEGVHMPKTSLDHAKK